MDTLNNIDPNAKSQHSFYSNFHLEYICYKDACTSGATDNSYLWSSDVQIFICNMEKFNINDPNAKSQHSFNRKSHLYTLAA
jgi:hypothetical protein